MRCYQKRADEDCTFHDPDHGNCDQPSRIFWRGKIGPSPGGKPLILAAIRDGDEWCNRTMGGLRVPGGAVSLL